MKNKAPVRTLIFALFFVSCQVSAASFSSMYVFGDSLSDIGADESAIMSIYKILGDNCDPSHPCPPYYEGRYSNGPASVEYLADAILPGGSNNTNFFSYAVAGSTTGLGNYGDGGTQSSSGSFYLPGMAQQIGLYLSGLTSAIDPNALYFVWGGANDFLTDAFAIDSPQLAARNIAGYVEVLASMGAENFVVPNLPDLSLTPFIKSLETDAVVLAQNFSVGFNQELAVRLDNLTAFFPTKNIVQFDTFSLFNDVIRNPADYGFTDIDQACLSLPGVCSDQDAYVFWDDFHPTTQIHAVIAAAITSEVPIPSSIFFLVTGLTGLFFSVPGKMARNTVKIS